MHLGREKPTCFPPSRRGEALKHDEYHCLSLINKISIAMDNEICRLEILFNYEKSKLSVARNCIMIKSITQVLEICGQNINLNFSLYYTLHCTFVFIYPQSLVVARLRGT